MKMPPRLALSLRSGSSLAAGPSCRSISSSPCLLDEKSSISALAALMDPDKNPSDARPRQPLRPARPSPQPDQDGQRQREQYTMLHSMVRRGNRSAAKADRRVKRRTTMEELEAHNEAVDVERQMRRGWRQGDVYAPHDLSATEMLKWKQRKRPTKDAFDALAINPIHEYKNFSMMAEYMTEMGRIKHSRDTALRPVNQRRVAKAIRRAVGIGLIPSAYRHPELLDMYRTNKAKSHG